MSVMEYQLFHGAVLAELVRADQTVNLRLIETKPAQRWAAYTVDDDSVLFIKHSKAPDRSEGGGARWPFTFQENQVHEIQEERRDAEVYVALMCGDEVVTGEMRICLLNPEEIDALLDFDSTEAQGVSVKYQPGKQLRVSGGDEKFTVPACRIRDWLD